MTAQAPESDSSLVGRLELFRTRLKNYQQALGAAPTGLRIMLGTDSIDALLVDLQEMWGNLRHDFGALKVDVVARNSTGVYSVMDEALRPPTNIHVTQLVRDALSQAIQLTTVAIGAAKRAAADERDQASRTATPGTPGVAKDPRRVAVVHGRDHKVRDGMLSFLSALDLHPIAFGDAIRETGKGSPHAREVLEALFATTQAVVILLTGDEDAVLRPHLRAQPGDEIHHAQARPNVWLEVGMALGVNPDRTILVRFGQHALPSDVDGLQYVRFDGSAKSRVDLRDRLETAGCHVKPHADFLTAGASNFEAALSDDEKGPLAASAQPAPARESILHLVPQAERRFVREPNGDVTCELSWLATAVSDEKVHIARVDWRSVATYNSGEARFALHHTDPGIPLAHGERAVFKSFPRRLLVTFTIPDKALTLLTTESSRGEPSVTTYDVKIIVTDARERQEVKHVAVPVQDT